MKILHFGGLPFLRRGLALAEQALGLTTFSEPAHQLGPLSLAFQPISLEQHTASLLPTLDIVHMHQLPTAQQLQDLIQIKKLGRAKLILQDYGFDNMRATDIELFDHVFLSSVENFALVSAHSSFSWLPASLALSNPTKVDKRESEYKELTVLHIPYAVKPKFTDQIISTVNHLKTKPPRFRFLLLKPEELENEERLLQAFKADLFVERVGSESYGPLALFALGVGCPVLSNNSKQAQNIWHHLSLSPVVVCDEKNIGDRLSSILREPRSLRDFSARSVRFIEERHKPEASAKLAIDVYKKLVAAPASQ